MTADYRYYPVTPAQKDWGLYVTCVGHHLTRPGAAFPSPEHPDDYYFTWKVGRTLHEWQIILVEKGHGEVEFKGSHAKVRSGSLIVIPPGSWHRYRPAPTTGWTTYWIGFGGDLADRLIGKAVFSQGGEVRNLDTEEPVFQRFATTVADLLSAAERTPFSAAAGIPLLIASLLENQKECKASPLSPILKAQSYITDHQSETIDFAELARSLGLSYRSFRYLFAKGTGTSPLHYLLERRLKRARNLLASSDLPVQKIAETLGFNSTWYFSHFFQKHAKSSPAAYRKQHRFDPARRS